MGDNVSLTTTRYNVQVQTHSHYQAAFKELLEPGATARVGGFAARQWFPGTQLASHLGFVDGFMDTLGGLHGVSKQIDRGMPKGMEWLSFATSLVGVTKVFPQLASLMGKALPGESYFKDAHAAADVHFFANRLWSGLQATKDLLKTKTESTGDEMTTRTSGSRIVLGSRASYWVELAKRVADIAFSAAGLFVTVTSFAIRHKLAPAVLSSKKLEMGVKVLTSATLAVRTTGAAMKWMGVSFTHRSEAA